MEHILQPLRDYDARTAASAEEMALAGHVADAIHRTNKGAAAEFIATTLQEDGADDPLIVNTLIALKRLAESEGKGLIAGDIANLIDALDTWYDE